MSDACSISDYVKPRLTCVQLVLCEEYLAKLDLLRRQHTNPPSRQKAANELFRRALKRAKAKVSP